MTKFKPEVIKACIQLGYPSETGYNKCDGEPILHLIILCVENKEKDKIALYKNDVQDLKDVSCCYLLKNIEGGSYEIIKQIETLVVEWLLEKTKLDTEDCLNISIRITDNYKDLKKRTECQMYFDNLEYK